MLITVAAWNWERYVTDAVIVHELPQPGETFQGRVVASVEPRPLDDLPQPSPGVYAYAIWLVTFVNPLESDDPPQVFVAIHEREAENL